MSLIGDLPTVNSAPFERWSLGTFAIMYEQSCTFVDDLHNIIGKQANGSEYLVPQYIFSSNIQHASINIKLKILFVTTLGFLTDFKHFDLKFP
jgi:hypothetical protein